MSGFHLREKSSKKSPKNIFSSAIPSFLILINMLCEKCWRRRGRELTLLHQYLMSAYLRLHLWSTVVRLFSSSIYSLLSSRIEVINLKAHMIYLPMCFLLEKKRNFKKYTHVLDEKYRSPYDYGSIMHYSRKAFSKNGKETIVPEDSNAHIGQRRALSAIDITEINQFYGCGM